MYFKKEGAGLDLVLQSLATYFLEDALGFYQRCKNGEFDAARQTLRDGISFTEYKKNKTQ